MVDGLRRDIGKTRCRRFYRRLITRRDHDPDDAVNGRSNRLLSHLGEADQERLEPHLEAHPLGYKAAPADAIVREGVVMAVRNAFYAQSGGVTAVINASARGLLQTARQHGAKIGKVYAGRNGIIGALTEDLIDTSVESEASIAALKHTPGAAFGSCR